MAAFIASMLTRRIPSFKTCSLVIIDCWTTHFSIEKLTQRGTVRWLHRMGCDGPVILCEFGCSFTICLLLLVCRMSRTHAHGWFGSVANAQLQMDGYVRDLYWESVPSEISRCGRCLLLHRVCWLGNLLQVRSLFALVTRGHEQLACVSTMMLPCNESDEKKLDTMWRDFISYTTEERRGGLVVCCIVCLSKRGATRTRMKPFCLTLLLQILNVTSISNLIE